MRGSKIIGFCLIALGLSILYFSSPYSLLITGSLVVSIFVVLAGLYYLFYDSKGDTRRSKIYGICLWVVAAFLLAMAFTITDTNALLPFSCLVFSVVIGMYGFVLFLYNAKGDTFDETFFGPGRYEEPSSVPKSNTVDKNISDISIALQGRGTQSGSTHDGAPGSWGSDPRFASSEINESSGRKGD